MAGCAGAAVRGSSFASHYSPGQRTLLDAHNSYPERGKFADRIDLALATGTPVAIEQDLYWARRPTGKYEIVVAHDSDALASAPTLEAHFFERIRPIMERALADPDHSDWPLVTLNLDFKTNERDLHAAVLALLRTHASWLMASTRTNTPDRAEPLRVGPLLVLSGQDSTQNIDFHDRVAIGEPLYVFGAIPLPDTPGATREARLQNQVAAPAEMLIPQRATNYARWVNFPWQVVELGGPTRAGPWTPADDARLRALVARAHANGLWIRFYTLDGYDPSQDLGLTTSYNFGSERAVAERWGAAISAGVDFIATDHYTRFHEARRAR